MSGLPMLPTVLTDVAGSVANIIFSFLATWYAFRLTRLKPDNFLWGYLFYVTLAIAAFSVSRAGGHIAREFLYAADKGGLWAQLSPYSGGFNTLCMIAVSSVMLFYHKGVQSYEAIEKEAARLKQSEIRLAATAKELRELNLGLEDMVEQRAAELSKSEKKFRHLFSASKDIVFFSGTNNALIEMNPAGYETLGYAPEEMAGLTLADIFHEADEVQSFNRSLNEDGFVRDYETEFRRKDKSLLYVLISATALYNEAGEIVGAEGIAKDLTRLKTVMEQLASSEKMASVGQMAAGIAHEINTPLGIILGYAQLMMDDFEEGSEPYQNLVVIERQTKASRKIVADLLKYSRQSGSIRQSVHLNEIVSDALAVTEHSLGLNHVQVQRELCVDLPPVMGDPEKLCQVVVNLINNASHAMEEQGGGLLQVRTCLESDEKFGIIEVQDSGHGIPSHIKARIFDPFFTTKPVGKGTGLGLSVSYGIMKEHGGTIEIESPVQSISKAQGEIKKGLGTLFRLRLPLATETDLHEGKAPRDIFPLADNQKG